ncbi:DUF4186 family protein [Thermodesulfobacteriota bacterium]
MGCSISKIKRDFGDCQRLPKRTRLYLFIAYQATVTCGRGCIQKLHDIERAVR